MSTSPFIIVGLVIVVGSSAFIIVLHLCERRSAKRAAAIAKTFDPCVPRKGEQ